VKKAFILVNVLPNYEVKICAKLKNMIDFQQQQAKPIEEFHVIFGEYDIIVEVNVERDEELYDIVWQISKLEGITKTRTCIEVPLDYLLKKSPLNNE
jgi:DNA-binding Lrp family transcriptional regulator